MVICNATFCADPCSRFFGLKISYMAGVAMGTRKRVVIMMHSVGPAFWAEAFNKHIGYNWYLLACVYGFGLQVYLPNRSLSFGVQTKYTTFLKVTALLTHTHILYIYMCVYLYTYISTYRYDTVYNIKNLRCWQGHFLFATDSAEMISSIFFQSWFNLCWAPVELVLQRLALAAGLLVFCWTR